MEADEEHVNGGTFAEEQEHEQHHRESDPGPSFSRGQEGEPNPDEENTHRGTFAEGQEHEQHHPESQPGPRFSRGQEGAGEQD